MGMYTGYRFRLRLRADTPLEVIDLLKAMTDFEQEVRERTDLPQHPFFLTRRWYNIFLQSGGGFYFEKTDAEKVESERSFTQNPETGSWLLEACGQTKGSKQDAALLLDWLKPWLMAAPWEVLAVARYEEDTSWRDSSCFGYAGQDSDEDVIDGEWSLQYWLVENQIVERQVPGCVTEIQLPIELNPNVKFKPVEFWFGRDMVEKMRDWPLEILPLGDAVAASVKRELELYRKPPISPQELWHSGNFAKREPELRTNHPDIKVTRSDSGLYTFIYPFGFNPNNRKVRARRNLSAPIPRQQAHGYYVHSHKGRGFRQGIPRPKMAAVITVEEVPSKPVHQALQPWLVLSAEKGPEAPREARKEDYGKPTMYFDTENSFDPRKLLGNG